MAQYNRDFLVPYLENICALYMADKKLIKKIQGIHYKINDCSVERQTYKPVAPPKQETASNLLVIIAVCFLIAGPLLLLGMGSAKDTHIGLMFFSAVFFTIAGIAILVNEHKKRKLDRAANLILSHEYERRIKKYQLDSQDVQAFNAGLRAQIPVLQAEIQYYENERNKIYQLINQAYQANVIPFQYRDMYAAVYFYNYFSTSGANDLDMAINTYVLEQIKQKLDTIIEQQSEMILNQRIMVAYQQQTLEEQRAHAARMEQYAYQIATSAEERNQYLSMIESNTAATAYFAAAQYFR